MSTEGQRKAQFYDAIKLRFNKCLDVTMSCSHAAIRAHSVQNSTALSYIEEDGHVSELRLRIENDKPVCRFQRIGRNNASTFTGLCGTHDTELLKPIDTKPLNITDAEQLLSSPLIVQLRVNCMSSWKARSEFKQHSSARLRLDLFRKTNRHRK